jgi:hypothetical protein
MRRHLSSVGCLLVLACSVGVPVNAAEEGVPDLDLSGSVFCDVFAVAEGEHAIFVVKGYGRSRYTAFRVAAPLEVWICLLTNGVPNSKNARYLGELPRACEMPNESILGCLRGTEYVFVYDTQWESGRQLATKTFPILTIKEGVEKGFDVAPRKVVVDGVETGAAVTEVSYLPSVLYLKWDQTEGGDNVEGVWPLALFAGKDGNLYLIGREQEGKKRLFSVRTVGDKWQKCKRLN